MHDTDAAGNEYFKCDFCGKAWSEELPMVEGHRGSLICATCLSVAYADVVLRGQSTAPPEGVTCAMCLEVRKDAQWQSPVKTESFVCLRCLKQSARMLEKDAESKWKRPEK